MTTILYAWLRRTASASDPDIEAVAGSHANVVILLAETYHQTADYVQMTAPIVPLRMMSQDLQLIHVVAPPVIYLSIPSNLEFADKSPKELKSEKLLHENWKHAESRCCGTQRHRRSCILMRLTIPGPASLVAHKLI